jgi:hypothetical protein
MRWHDARTYRLLGATAGRHPPIEDHQPQFCYRGGTRKKLDRSFLRLLLTS